MMALGNKPIWHDMKMNSETVLSKARIVLPDDVITGSLVMRAGIISEVCTGLTETAGAVDCGGAYLVPGLIELHTDNLERHIQPRPGVDWLHRAAIFAHDSELAGTGITTVFDAIRVGSIVSAGAGSGTSNMRDRWLTRFCRCAMPAP
jgi:alpha-D-ribose 1-methylphosphonate 5-triphosphate diphosphatase